MSPTRTTVVICAYTMARWDHLEEAVASAAAEGPAEVLLVVDHNADLLERARQEFTAARVLPNILRQGLSGGRNTALLAARTDIVAFLDDDACAERGWLSALVAPFCDPDVLGVGGTALPRWPDGGRRPVTLPLSADGARGVLDWVVGCSFAGQPVTAGPIRNLMGCNMAVRRRIAIEVGGFAENLGRVGATPLGCEETELCIRASRLHPHGRFVFEPAACVHHHVSPDRLTWGYLVRRGYAEGVSKAMVGALSTRSAALSTERSYALRVLPAAVWHRVSRGDVRGAAAIVACLVCTAAGYVRGRVAIARSGVPVRSGLNPDAVAVD